MSVLSWWFVIYIIWILLLYSYYACGRIKLTYRYNLNNYRYRIKKCKCLFLSILIDKDDSNQKEEVNITITDLPEFATSDVFSSYVKSNLLDLPLSPRQLLGISWKSKSVILQVMSHYICNVFTLFIIHFVLFIVITSLCLCAW